MIPVGQNKFKAIVQDEIKEIEDFDTLRIREIVRLVNSVERRTGVKYIRMEMGVPGLQANRIAAKAEAQAHANGLASRYPMIEGAPALKEAGSVFIKQFLNINIDAKYCIPTVGTMQAYMASSMVVNRLHPIKNKTLFIDPCFPMQKKQSALLGHDYEAFDVYAFRGEKLREKLESYFATGRFSSVIYSNPNNPTWICLTEEELQIIGELAEKYDIIILEDLAYFGLDMRHDYLTPGKPPYQPTAAKYTDNYIIWISASKLFSYAGQRASLTVISPKLYEREYPYLKRLYDHTSLGDALIYGAIYALTSGVSHTVQYGFAALLNALSDGSYKIYNDVNFYKNRAIALKKVFLENGFELVYDKDLHDDIADGFYFTIARKGISSSDLVRLLLEYGISTMSLKLTGSNKPGIRVCVSMISKTQIPELHKRLSLLSEHIKKTKH